MSEQKQERRAIIEYAVAKPFVDAVALGLAVGGPASFDGKFLPFFIGGSSFSLAFYWVRGNLFSLQYQSKKIRRPKKDYIRTNWGEGKITRFEQVAPGFVTRQPFWRDVLGLVKKPQPPPVYQPAVNPTRPQTLEQFAFQSWDDAGNPVQLLSCDVRNFLRRAWIYKDRGKGLGRRFWDYRNERNWPQWYAGPQWYEAMINLLLFTEEGLGRQLIIVIQKEPRRVKLRFDARGSYEHILWWYVTTKKG